MKQILRNTGYTDEVTFYVDGTATDADGTVTLTVTSADGTVLESAVTTTNVPTGTYQYTLGPYSALDDMTMEWTGTFSGLAQTVTTNTSIVGGFLFTESELRAFYSSDMSNEATFSDDDIRETRDRITVEFENICAVAFVPTYRRQTVAGDGSRVLWIDRPYVSEVVSATVGSTSQTVADLTLDDVLPVVHHTTSVWTNATATDPRNITISYVHGHAVVPGDVKRAAMILARQQLVKDTGAGVPETASSWNDGTGQYVSFAANDQTGRWYGIPSVDSVLRRYSMRIPVA